MHHTLLSWIVYGIDVLFFLGMLLYHLSYFMRLHIISRMRRFDRILIIAFLGGAGVLVAGFIMDLPAWLSMTLACALPTGYLAIVIVALGAVRPLVAVKVSDWLFERKVRS